MDSTSKLQFNLTPLQKSINKCFQTVLSDFYNQINRVSDVFWSHGSSIFSKSRRSQTDKNVEKWRQNTNACLGYGQLTKNLSFFINQLDDNQKQKLIFEPSQYNLVEDSTFLDIGSGFGKPVYHTAMQVGCLSHGIQVVPARVEFSESFYFDKQQRLQEKTEQLLEKCKDMVQEIQVVQNQKQQVSEQQIVQTFPEKMKSLQYEMFDAQLHLRQEQFDIKKLDLKTYFSFKKAGLKIWECLDISTQHDQQLIEDEHNLINKSTQQTSVLIPKLFRYNTPQQVIKRNMTKKRGNKKIGRGKTKIEEKCQANFKKDWLKKVKFFLKDGAKESTFVVDQSDRSYVNKNQNKTQEQKDQRPNKRMYSHLYSYNKVMAATDLEKICQAINNSDWKVLCWYQNPKSTRKFGLKNFMLVHKYSIQSTGNQKYTAFIFARTKAWKVQENINQVGDDDQQINQNNQDDCDD